MIIGIGTDLFRISRIAPEAVSESDPFVMRAFTEKERDAAKGRPDVLNYYATRFAGKEAVYKAVSICGEQFRPGDIEILTDTDGRPHARLLNRTAAAFEKKFGKGYQIHISLSYDTDYALAFAQAEK